jgi:hypothetical protein
MATINFKKQGLFNLNGQQIKRIDVDESKKEIEIPLFLDEVVIGNLTKEDTTCTPTDRFNRFLLAEKIKKADGDVDLTIDELSTIKKVVGEHPNPLIIGRVWNYIESETGKKEKDK